MKALVVYDSVYGSTEEIAKAIGGAIGKDVKAVRASEANPSLLKGLDLLIVGSPTQAGKPLAAIRDFIDKLPAGSLKDTKAATFDTRISTKFVGVFGYAAGRIGVSLKEKGGELVTSPEGFFVKGLKGPLKEGELERAAEWGRGLAKTGK